ncbi:hypothetical protein AHMF7605_29290 [Adhaeribacter arboris]|uniref:IPT/TIG domain-containing protein n=1 Tax=Adhaeribacter arboris TaxID=2072846 RepID=A0A2T2Y910_9BACT|nr:IPT/TIG domain-containing protein [Adhaeribacter arboris]PSR52002.1 hypothetical protein AHMF7605_29290 [Adhaeribacter arboris]
MTAAIFWAAVPLPRLVAIKPKLRKQRGLLGSKADEQNSGPYSISAVSTIGGQVTLTGQNLSAVTAVKVGNSTYSNLEINSAGTQIRFNYPPLWQNLKVVAWPAPWKATRFLSRTPTKPQN